MADVDELQKQFDFYVSHQDELVGEFKDRWIVIADERVVKDFDTETLAYQYAVENCTPGSFMIQLVEPGQENYSQTFHSRVIL